MAPRAVLGLTDPIRSAMQDLNRLDQAVYATIAATPTPALDLALRRLSNAANFSRLWIAVASGIAVVGEARGRRAAVQGMAAIGIGSAVTNVVAKRLLVRQRPDPIAAAVAYERQVRMPDSTSFPSGHAASAFAFATAAATELPVLSLPLHALAAAVGYSRVHTGVHYPGDVVVGALIGTAAGGLVVRAVRFRREHVIRIG